jgi:hypothetical protein
MVAARMDSFSRALRIECWRVASRIMFGSLLFPVDLPAQPRRFQRPASRLSPGPHDEMITPKTQQSNTKIGKTPNHICAKTLWPKKF